MKAFVVLVNGKPLCTAGIGRDGVLSGHVTWAGQGGHGDLSLHIGGLDSSTDEFVGWPAPDVGVGDEITFRIVESEAVDPPSRREKAERNCEAASG